MSWFERTITLKPRKRGFHLITDELVAQLPELKNIDLGLAHFFIQHTSASLTINENADPTVRQDLESHFNQFVPEGATYYRHDYEGDDDMPAHIKASILGASISVPIKKGKLQLGTWQGITLGEHRDCATSRKVVATLQGQLKQ
ncbi:secondary thiamine-phosphate synthase enzyme YjbQ [Pseudoalteromonas tunicata]|uniref:secondary thiamine-phosphate synthase enzyme YjbQ n=1 Tax=Pseudoalteromonas tunicata TaxID=314281 RepID=UPI00273ED397|nr:secondary thiamine-phosphate synthase enzyme YjbQ [Pseudoalteromonas tunicata]MDP4983642.1 secondary thiamine-phosphate synthase enzyme YjbQ [Pseudoalteromonas tunicata]